MKTNLSPGRQSFSEILLLMIYGLIYPAVTMTKTTNLRETNSGGIFRYTMYISNKSLSFTTCLQNMSGKFSCRKKETKRNGSKHYVSNFLVGALNVELWQFHYEHYSTYILTASVFLIYLCYWSAIQTLLSLPELEHK
jgi:hypothetical protein